MTRVARRNVWGDLHDADVIDLSVVTSSALPSAWPLHQPFSATLWNSYDVETPEASAGPQGLGPYRTRYWVIDEHTGTHFDAPTHFIAPPDSGLAWAGELGLESADRVPLNELMGPADVIDVSEMCGLGDNGTSPPIEARHIEAWETTHGAIERGDVVLLNTGWDRHYRAGSAGDQYSRAPLAGLAPGWPAPDRDAVLLLHRRGVRCVGIDAPSIGDAQEGTAVHREGLSRGMRFVELLTGLGRLPVRGSFFMFLPTRIADSTGAPGRAVAFIASRRSQKIK